MFYEDSLEFNRTNPSLFLSTLIHASLAALLFILGGQGLGQKEFVEISFIGSNQVPLASSPKTFKKAKSQKVRVKKIKSSSKITSQLKAQRKMTKPPQATLKKKIAHLQATIALRDEKLKKQVEELEREFEKSSSEGLKVKNLEQELLAKDQKTREDLSKKVKVLEEDFQKDKGSLESFEDLTEGKEFTENIENLEEEFSKSQLDEITEHENLAKSYEGGEGEDPYAKAEKQIRSIGSQQGQGGALGRTPSRGSRGKGLLPTNTRSYRDLEQRLGNLPPIYPIKAREENKEGVTYLIYFVNEQGFVDKIHIYRSSGYPLLDQAAVKGIARFRYQPGQSGWVIHDVKFNLIGKAEEGPSRLRTY